MATTKPITGRREGAGLRMFFRRHCALAVAAVEGAACLLRLPVPVHLLLAVGVELAITVLNDRGRSG